MARHTSFKIGGPAQLWFEPVDILDLRRLVVATYKKEIPLRVIGMGSNILVDDRGIQGIVIRLNSSYFKRITVPNSSLTYDMKQRDSCIINVGAGLSVNRLLRYAQSKGLSGLESLAGIPGTVGGVLVMNAGDVGDKVLHITVMDKQGRIKTIKRRQAGFGYRESKLDYYIILNVDFQLSRWDSRMIQKKIDRFLEYRRKTQDLYWPSAGCFFKNPSITKRRINTKHRSTSMSLGSAAYFIERCGLKGSFVGDAAVSLKHANFIINKGRASFSDVLKLKDCITKCVEGKFNLRLEPEVRIWR